MTNTATLKLTTDQAKAIAKMRDFIVNSENRFFRLTGYAGTGKSFTICQLIKWLLSAQYNVIAASPTNKAAKNLENMASEAGLNLEVTTVAKLLGQQAEIDTKTGKEKFVSKGTEDISSYDVIIIDEFSMVNKDNFTDIKIEVEDADETKVIFVGDKAQLPPVGEDEPIVADHYCIRDYANLEQVAANMFQSDEFKVNPNYVRFLVWRNKQADTLNAYVRQHLWGEDALAYLPGDRLIAKTPVFRLAVDAFTLKDKWQIIVNASDECEVTRKGILREKDEYGHNWQHYLVPVTLSDGNNLRLRILTESGLHEQKKTMLALKAKAKAETNRRKRGKLWGRYYDCLKSFDNTPYAYAITTHKAQGSSIDYAFVDTTDMKHCPDLQKILYTALTRAKTRAFVPSY
ncbi:MAG: AAA family ATPase [Xenococcaceae cyanobacterium MO_188.B29]|nr:AAA family ATPase [Xenococcaceae cyanobacterium MO_188.B29]